ncbi:hypothetical protein JD79_03377 [Geodermatophilus normandii]|uniref:Uncharacterized protein n=1 Tax=Geodermatophilus normandii TaxID=1137989 RepID=A0A317QMD1_9ACTN|nr:hypothetical protein [Geodermatophilus normandii]PWW24199.1 hypothetical protein JD79_03377 [Geodermatophilus normandii]
MTVRQDRSASLLVRVWLEGEDDVFRARLTSVQTSPGAAAGQEATVGVASSPGDVLALVQTWLTGFLGPGADLPPDAP